MSEENQLSQTELLKVLVEIHAEEKKGSSSSDLAARLGKAVGTINRTLGNLVFRKLVRTASRGVFEPTAAGRKMIADGETVKSGPRPGKSQSPRSAKPDTFRVRIWRAITTKKKFTISEIVQLAANSTDKNPIDTARRYVNDLRRADYLVELPRRQKTGKSTSNGEKVFWLRIDCPGRIPPRVRKSPDGIPGMFDQNDKTYRPFDVERASEGVEV